MIRSAALQVEDQASGEMLRNRAFDITIAWVGTAGIRGQIWFWAAQAGKSYGPSNWGSTFGPASSYGRFKYWIHN